MILGVVPLLALYLMSSQVAMRRRRGRAQFSLNAVKKTSHPHVVCPMLPPTLIGSQSGRFPSKGQSCVNAKLSAS